MRRHTYTYVCPYPDNNCKNNFCQIFCNEGSCAYVHRYEYAHYAQVLVYARAYPSPGLQKHFCQIFSDKKVRTSAKARQGWVCTYAEALCAGTRTYTYVCTYPAATRTNNFCQIFLLVLVRRYTCAHYAQALVYVRTRTCVSKSRSNQHFLSDFLSTKNVRYFAAANTHRHRHADASAYT